MEPVTCTLLSCVWEEFSLNSTVCAHWLLSPSSCNRVWLCTPGWPGMVIFVSQPLSVWITVITLHSYPSPACFLIEGETETKKELWWGVRWRLRLMRRHRTRICFTPRCFGNICTWIDAPGFSMRLVPSKLRTICDAWHIPSLLSRVRVAPLVLLGLVGRGEFLPLPAIRKRLSRIPLVQEKRTDFKNWSVLPTDFIWLFSQNTNVQMDSNDQLKKFKGKRNTHRVLYQTSLILFKDLYKNWLHHIHFPLFVFTGIFNNILKLLFVMWFPRAEWGNMGTFENLLLLSFF